MPTFRNILLILFYCLNQVLTADSRDTTLDKMINSSLKTNVLPCENFYSYACGNYNEQTFFNVYLQRRDLHAFADLHYNKAIINLLETSGQQQHQIEERCQTLTEKIRTYFESCREVRKRNLTRYLEEIKPGPDLNWPIFESKNNETSKWPHDKNFDFFTLLGKVDSIGMLVQTFFNAIQRNDEARERRILMSPHHSFTEIFSPAKRIEILSMLLLLEVENPLQLLEDASETARILQQLAEEHEPPFGLRISFVDLLIRYPNLNFASYFLECLGEQVPLSSEVSISRPSFFQKLNDKMWLLFDKSKLCNYIMIHYLSRFDATTEFNNMFCVNEVRHVFKLALDLLYYHHNIVHQEKLVKPDVTKIFETVADMMGKHLQSHDLQLTIHQIELLRQKLAGVRLNIGSLPDNASCGKIAQFYSSVSSLNENNYYKNNLLMLRFINTRFYKVNLGIHDYAPLRIPSDSEPVIGLSYAYLVPPIYDFNYNNLDKYSLLGFILARMLAAYFNIGALNSYNEIGFSQPLQSAVECLKKPSPNGSVLDIAQRVEDIVASEVVRKIVTLKFFNLQPIQTVPSWKKHFFLNVAQHYCNANNDIDNFGEAKSDRLNRIAMNIEGFSQAFNCPGGSEMKTSEKCKI